MTPRTPADRVEADRLVQLWPVHLASDEHGGLWVTPSSFMDLRERIAQALAAQREHGAQRFEKVADELIVAFHYDEEHPFVQRCRNEARWLRHGYDDAAIRAGEVGGE